MNDSPKAINLDQDAVAELEALKDEYAARLVKQVIAHSGTLQSGELEVSADDLRAAATGRLSLELVLHLVAGGAVVLLVAGIAVLAFALLPETVHGTSARVGLGLGLFGALVAALASVGLYAMRRLGADVMADWLRERRSDTRRD
jgi:hypothetical protein